MTRTAGQQEAARQTTAIAKARPDAIEVVRTVEPSEPGDALLFDVSVDCSGFSRTPEGVDLHQRERLLITVPADFPFSKPEVETRHRRWAGTPHVQWGRHLCLYQAPVVEWIPSDGMFGFFDRLIHWLESAATGQLDPAGGAMHPPAVYVRNSPALIIPRKDTPPVADTPWLGWVDTNPVSDKRIDLGSWTPHQDGDGKWNVPSPGAAAAFLIPSTLDWEYPEYSVSLLVALLERGIDFGDLLMHLRITSLGLEAGEPMLVVVGTAMRGVVGEAPRQHLAAWMIPAEVVDDLRSSVDKFIGDEETRELGQAADKRAFEWMRDAKVRWCSVREDRPEIVTRRDDGSPMEVFAGKRVAVWGCGALGAPVAHALARAGVSSLVLADSGVVTPGILVRQPFADRHIGKGKARIVSAQVRAVRPDLPVDVEVTNLKAVLDDDNWHRDADIIIDCSANGTVRSKLERVLRNDPKPPIVACLLVGHTAEHGMAVVSSPAHSGGSEDVLRATKLECLRRRDLVGFANEFWPEEPRAEHFQPEPGCSDATFRGSSAEVSALSALMLLAVARDLRSEGPWTARGHLLALPGISHPGPATWDLDFEAATTTTVASKEYEVRMQPGASRELRDFVAAGVRRLGGPSSETGGLIFGQRDDAAGVIWIERLTGPPADSQESAAEFVCGTEGVDELCKKLQKAGRGSLEFLGMWHTHPDGRSEPSRRDLMGMAHLSVTAPSPLTRGLILIVGHARSLTQKAGGPPADIAAYLYDGDTTQTSVHVTVSGAEPMPVAAPREVPRRDIGLALSGGGSRAIAFHLGCLRALNDRGLLDRVRVVSGISGGSVLTALYAYADDSFEQFDERVQALLRRGLHSQIALRSVVPSRLAKGIGTRLAAGSAAGVTRAAAFAGGKLGRSISSAPPMRRWSSRTDAFQDVLQRSLFGNTTMPQVGRQGLDVVINACDLTTGSAFRFGSQQSGTYRLGTVAGNDLLVAEAVAASAAYPLLLPALDREYRFTPLRGGAERKARVVLTDGGVFDNLGTSCLVPGRDPRFSTNVHDVDYIIACDAGRGLLDPFVPFSAPTRVARSFGATFRKAQDATRNSLHRLVEHGELRGFVMPYLGQNDRALPQPPADLISREQVADYPTNFAAMSDENIELIAGRGEQLTRLLIQRWCPEL